MERPGGDFRSPRGGGGKKVRGEERPVYLERLGVASHERNDFRGRDSVGKSRTVVGSSNAKRFISKIQSKDR